MASFTGMLALTVAVGGLGLSELRRHNLALQKDFEQSRSAIVEAVAAGTDITKITRAAFFSPGTAPQDGLTKTRDFEALAARIERLAESPAFGEQLPGEVSVAEVFKEYGRALAQFSAAAPATIPERAGHFLTDVLPHVEALRDALLDVIVWHLRDLSARSEMAQQRTARAQKALVTLLVFGALGSGILMMLTGRAIIRPTDELLAAIQKVTRRELDVNVPQASTREFRRLAEAVNVMAGKLREYEQSDKSALARSQAVARLAVDSLPAAVCMVDCDGLIEVANDSAVELFGFREGSNMYDSEWPRLITLVRESCGSGQPIIGRGYDEAITVKDGDERMFVPTVVPIKSDQNAVTGVTLIANDVTHYRQLDQLKTTMISTVSHELKTPLTSIRMAVYLLLGGKAGQLTQLQRDILGTAREDCERLLSTINEVLDLSRIEGGNLKLDLEQTRITQLVDWAVAPLRSRFEDSGLVLIVNVPSDLPALELDRSRMVMALSNLLTNAVKYCRTGDTVMVTAAESGRQGHVTGVEIVVRDTGPGMPEDKCERIFERFYRLEDGRSRGTGLGLFIAREIARAHGGDITCESKPSMGAAFRVRLPVQPAPGDTRS